MAQATGPVQTISPWTVSDEELDEYAIDGTENLGTIIGRLNKILPIAACRKLKIQISVGAGKFEMSYPTTGKDGVGSGLAKAAQTSVMIKMVTINCWRARTEKYRKSTYGDDTVATERWLAAVKNWGYHVDGFDATSDTVYNERAEYHSVMSRDRFIMARSILRWILDKRVRLFVDNRRQDVQKANGIHPRNQDKYPVAYDMEDWVSVDNIQGARVAPPQKPRFTTAELTDMHVRSIASIGVAGSSEIVNNILDVYSRPPNVQYFSNDEDEENDIDISRSEEFARKRKRDLEQLLESVLIKTSEIMDKEGLEMTKLSQIALRNHFQNSWVTRWTEQHSSPRDPVMFVDDMNQFGSDSGQDAASEQSIPDNRSALLHSRTPEMATRVKGLTIAASPTKRLLSPPLSSPDKVNSHTEACDGTPSKKRRTGSAKVMKSVPCGAETMPSNECSNIEQQQQQNYVQDKDDGHHAKPVSPGPDDAQNRMQTRSQTKKP